MIESEDVNHERLHIENRTIGFYEAIQDNVYRNNLIIMTINWSSTSLGYYVIGFFLEDFSGSIYINALLMQLAEMITYISANYYMKFFGINHGFTLANILVVIFGIIYTIAGNFVGVTYA